MRRRCGFTLMELVVVIAIITVVMSIMVPALFKLIKVVRHLGQ